MIVHEILETENHPVYKALEVANGNRQYDFLQSAVKVALELGRPFLSSAVIKALNYHAIACLHTHAGEYRPCPVKVGQDADAYMPPAHYRVAALTEDFINTVNRAWEKSDPVALAAFVLWRLNHIHPFINGNGRTARAACYFVVCAKAGSLLPGTTILPELLRRERDRYVAALKQADNSVGKGALDLTELHTLINELLEEQVTGVNPNAPAASGGSAAPPGPPVLPAP